MIIDAHVHVWNLTRGHYDWPNTSVPELNHTMTVDDLALTPLDDAERAAVLGGTAARVYGL